MAPLSRRSASAPVLASAATLALALSRLAVLLVLCSVCTGVSAYVPAQPSDDPNAVVPLARNASASMLSMQWWAAGAHNEPVAYQLVAEGSAGLTQGALVHFSESDLTGGTTAAPWIALISCDANATDAAADDIFSLAQQRGATSALLYSLNSSVCIINPSFAAGFDHSMDVFITESQDSARTIEDQFGSINATYWSFSAELLNSTYAEITSAVSRGSVQAPGFMIASLIADNATAHPQLNQSGSNTSSTPATTDHHGGGPNTSLAMIILYAITGCVSALFCVVIVSGAVRAIRHPERYGPRAGDAGLGSTGAGAQSRARGLTHAFLDTFPVVKFGGPAGEDGAPRARAKDVEAAEDGAWRKGQDVELRAWEVVEDAADAGGEREARDTVRGEGGAESPGAGTSSEHSASSVGRARPRAEARRAAGGRVEKEVVPDAIGRETCPICIVDFAEGDDLRVLPCEGHHRFHQECVDPWLLELSSSCPICRQDFQALETMMAASGDADDQLEPPHMPGASRPLSTAAARFSRYLRSARRRRRDREDGHGYDATDPPMPMALGM